MTDIMQVPANVAAIIAAKKMAMAEEAEEHKRQIAEAEAVAKAKALIFEKVREFEENIPQWMLQYERTAEFINTRDSYDLVMIGRNQRTFRSLFFEVPGLSTIEFNFEDDEWRSSSAGWNDPLVDLSGLDGCVAGVRAGRGKHDRVLRVPPG